MKITLVIMCCLIFSLNGKSFQKNKTKQIDEDVSGNDYHFASNQFCPPPCPGTRYRFMSREIPGGKLDNWGASCSMAPNNRDQIFHFKKKCSNNRSRYEIPCGFEIWNENNEKLAVYSDGRYFFYTPGRFGPIPTGTPQHDDQIFLFSDMGNKVFAIKNLYTGQVLQYDGDRCMWLNHVESNYAVWYLVPVARGQRRGGAGR